MHDLFQQFFQRDAGPWVQFIKYALVGGVATAVDIFVFYLFAWKFIPALRETDPVVRFLKLKVNPVTEQQRSNRFIIITAIAFLVSNFICYLLNVWWVFEPGRHVWYVEMGLFYIGSGISIVLGTATGWVMIKYFHTSTTASYLAKMIASLLINYATRKFIIFKG